MKQLPSKGVDRLALSIGSQTLSGVNVQQQFTWSSGDPVKLNVVYGADGNFTQPDNGSWAIFQFIDRASTKVPAGSPTVFTWNLSFGNRPVTLPDGTPVQAIYQINAPGNVFARSPMHCVAEAAAAR